MKRLTRFLWLAAWSSWLWLGFGLYRELPRETGPVVAKKVMAEGEFEDTPTVGVMYDIRMREDAGPMVRFSFETVVEINLNSFLVEER